jgi:DNA-binding CsgD family transcriptional regulator
MTSRPKLAGTSAMPSTRVPLLERQVHLASLRSSFDTVRTLGRGRCALVYGEAGIGKTSLLRAFSQGLPPGTTVLSCGCEALFTPRPLGPLIDLIDHFPPSVERALHQGAPYNVLFPALLRWLGERSPARVFIIDDMQWADVGTIDFMRFLGRRVHDLPLLLIGGYRAEGIDAEHPLQRLLGDLPAASTLRLELPPLSRHAVASLALAAGRPADAVYAASHGNPFYVTELLAADGDAVPASLRDAVLTALARLSPQARELAVTVSLFPGHADISLLRAMSRLGDDATSRSALAECLRAGMLVGDAASLAFRHEIARNVVHDAMPPHECARGHAAALHAYDARDRSADDTAHRMHHAEAAGLGAEAAALAPLAAQRAAATGDHREAARLFALALRDAPSLDDVARADLLELWSDELTLINRHRHAIEAREAALAIHEARGDRRRQGMCQRWLARLCWFDGGSSGPSLRWAERAIDTLSALRPSRELALAYSTMSHLLLTSEDMVGALNWGLRAIEMAEAVDDAEVMTHALNNVACAMLRQRDDALAWERLSRSLDIALQHGLVIDAARAYNNLFILSVVRHDFDAGLRWAETGLAFCEANGLDVFTVRIGIRRAFARIVMGQWDLAAAELAEIAGRHAPSPMESATHAFVASLLSLRRGESDARQRLEVGISAMQAHRVEVWFITTAAARAECAWMQGDLEAAQAAARSDLERIVAVGDAWRAGELAAWMQRAGGGVDASRLPKLPKPYAHEVAGEWREAADAWAALGCPYNRALALCGGDEAALVAAVGVFDDLGARGAAVRVRELLRQRGVRSVPRGPQPRTRDDPLNLTARERQIFELLRRGASNAAMAEQLHRSERTVEHHVSALLRKLGLRSRVELLTRHPPSTDAAP